MRRTNTSIQFRIFIIVTIIILCSFKIFTQTVNQNQVEMSWIKFTKINTSIGISEIENTNETFKLQLKEIFNTIKTSKHFHSTRAEVIVSTWFQKVANQTYFITDDEDLNMQIKTNNHLIVTSCTNDHSPKGLNCKMEKEIETFLKNKAKWWCHWDDDNYVNVNELRKFLEKFDSEKSWYIGRASLDHPLEQTLDGKTLKYWFAHGGCGFCVSQALVKKMKVFVENGEFQKLGSILGISDDCVVGFIINNLLGTPLTNCKLFNSHYHSKYLMEIPSEDITKQISLSYSGEKIRVNLGTINSSFTPQQDPTRFFSVHCLIYPETPYCNNLSLP